MIALVATARFALVSVVSVVLAALSLVSLPSMPEVGRASPGVELSRDLEQWTADLDDPLFLPGLPWRPGDERASTFFVRNSSDAAAAVEVTLSRAPAPATDPYVTVDVETRAGGSVLLEPDESSQVVRLGEMSEDETVAVTLRATLSATAPPGVGVDGDTIDVRAALDETAGGGGILSTAHLELAPLFLGFAMIGAVIFVQRTRGKRRGT